jgi:hypothetical protein
MAWVERHREAFDVAGPVCPYLVSDFDGNGIVDFLDLQYFLRLFGKGCVITQ